MNRRRFLRRWIRALATVGTTVVTGIVPIFRTTKASDETLHLRTLNAIADTIVPGDEAPGAVDAGVVPLLVSLIERGSRSRTLYAAGLLELNGHCLETYRTRFADLDLDTRTRVLADLTTGTPWRLTSASRMIALVRNQVLVLFYSSPAAYRMLDYTAPRFGYLQGVERRAESGIGDG